MLAKVVDIGSNMVNCTENQCDAETGPLIYKNYVATNLLSMAVIHTHSALQHN